MLRHVSSFKQKRLYLIQPAVLFRASHKRTGQCYTNITHLKKLRRFFHSLPTCQRTQNAIPALPSSAPNIYRHPIFSKPHVAGNPPCRIQTVGQPHLAGHLYIAGTVQPLLWPHHPRLAVSRLLVLPPASKRAGRQPAFGTATPGRHQANAHLAARPATTCSR